MKTAEPKIIYLQIGEDADITEFEESDFQTNAISWCWERMFDNDIEYISKQSIIDLIDEMADDKDYRDIAQLYSIGKREALTELKQKIEEL